MCLGKDIGQIFFDDVTKSIVCVAAFCTGAGGLHQRGSSATWQHNGPVCQHSFKTQFGTQWLALTLQMFLAFPSLLC